MDIQVMEPIYIWGAGRLGVQVMRKLQQENLQVSAFIDKNIQHKCIDDVVVMTFEEFKKQHQEENGCVLISATNAKNIFQMFDKLKTCPSFDVGIVKLIYKTRRIMEKSYGKTNKERYIALFQELRLI